MAGSISHSLVPWHEVLSDQEALQELAPYGIVNDGVINLSALPPIPMDDPALLGACVPRPAGVSSDWPLNKIVRIERRSVFSGISIAYRVVSNVSAFPAAFKGRKRADQLGIKEVQELGLIEVDEDEQLEAFDVESDVDATDLILVDEELDYDNMTVQQLKDILRDKGMKLSGKKADLIERLREE